MSKPFVSESYAAPSLSSASSHPSHQRHLQGPNGAGLISRPSLSSSSSSSSSSFSSPSPSSPSSAPLDDRDGVSDGTGAASASFRPPSRLIPASTSGLSVPKLARTSVGAQPLKSKAAAAGAASPVGTNLSAQVRVSDNGSKTVGQEIGAVAAEGSAVTSQPPVRSESAIAASQADASEQIIERVTTPPGGSQVPTMAQRDALTSQVYSMCRSAGYSNWLHLLELAPLASQHHLSGYNCMKFGYQGSPYAYLPLTMQQPWQADALAEKQRVNETEAMEWLIQKRKRKLKLDEVDRGTKRGGGVLEEDGSRPRWMEEEERKIVQIAKGVPGEGSSNSGGGDDRPMRDVSPMCTPSSDDDVKINGPLQAEVVLSQEWEAPLKSGLAATSRAGLEESASSSSSSPTPEAAASSAIKTSASHPISISPIIPPELLVEVTRHVQLGLPVCVRSKGVATSSHEEINTGQHSALQVRGQRLIRCHTTAVDLCEVAQRAEREMLEAAHSKSRPRLLALEASFHPSTYLETVCQGSIDDCEGEGEGEGEGGDRTMVPVAFGGNYRGFTIGNLLLSSCPGKKVRLTGPVRGRGAICRNLGLDLKRIRLLGVGALVCCLDDEELNFLGAPWSLYEKEADRLGMEVIRLPMAEGFCPTDVPTTDNAISSIVEQYTLRGINVLVHCRGGVGRAGLIACAWMLKLGLVRSDCDEATFQRIVKRQANQFGQFSKDDRQGGGMEGQEERMQVIHRLIDTIRRRRSPKAIETAEQVAFLFKYVTYLRNQEERRDTAAQSPPLPAPI